MRRIWIVGNGPSLLETPLSQVREESVGINRIHLIFGTTTWRPTYYFCTDLPRNVTPMERMNKEFNDVFRHHAGPKFTRDSLWSRLDADLREQVTPLPTCKEMTPLRDNVARPTKWHLPQYCRYGGTMFSAIQWAVMKGYRELVIVGADIGYTTGRNHFSEDYNATDLYTEDQARIFNTTLIDAHSIAKRECETLGVNVINATVGGNLEVYPRVALEELL